LASNICKTPARTYYIFSFDFCWVIKECGEINYTLLLFVHVFENELDSKKHSQFCREAALFLFVVVVGNN
jgi:hypothetical protein